MSAPAITVDAGQPLVVACSLMEHYAIDHLPVVSRMRIVGMLCHSKVELEEPECRRAVTFAKTPVVTVDADAPISLAAELMRAHGIRCLPVVVGEALLGVVTRSDILGFVIRRRLPEGLDRRARAGKSSETRSAK
ncbi:MAG TPA: CBS domain-containing protein [Polyangiaceae bacterium]|jgi:CBS domain-containing protein